MIGIYGVNQLTIMKIKHKGDRDLWNSGNQVL